MARPEQQKDADLEQESGAQEDGPPQGLQVLRRRNLKIDYKDAGLLKYFIADRGKLVPRRLTGNCASTSARSAGPCPAPA